MNLADARVFEVPLALVNTTDESLMNAGKDGYELFALWTGVLRSDTFHVEHLYLPGQRSYKGEDGLHVRVGADELDKLNRWLYQHRQSLGIQVHSHPQQAFHSRTDDSYPIVTTVGGLSIVVPNFGAKGITGPGTITYRLSEKGWKLIPAEKVERLFRVIT